MSFEELKEEMENSEFGTKGFFRSKTILYIGGAIAAFLLEKLTSNSDFIVSWLVALTPDAFDPFVPRAWELLLEILQVVLMLLGIKSRATATKRIEGLWKKSS